MAETLNKDYFLPYRDQMLQRIREKHFRVSDRHEGRLFLISTAYPGFWLEHLFDSVVWARMFPEDKDLPVSQVRLFLENQREDGKIPDHILDNDLMNTIPGLTKAYTGKDVAPAGLAVVYTQLQECVSLASLCWEIWQMNPADDLAWYYDCCCKWDAWLCQNRMTRGKGLVETYCGFDTGHDNSSRFAGIKYKKGLCPIPSEYPKGYPIDCEQAPLLSPDVNAVFYGSRIALANMAEKLGKADEAASWREKAAQVKKNLLEICFDPEEYFFFDIDKHDRKIPVKSISITNLFCEHVLDQDMFEEIYRRYFDDPKEFGTPYGFPGASISDPNWIQRIDGNDWGFYSQGNVAIRTLRWMEYYGKTEEMHAMMSAWLRAWCREGILKFGQELHPLTGEPSACSEWYSSTMLYLLYSMKTFGIGE